MQPGIYKDLSNDIYHSDKSSISRSALKDFDKNPYYYWSMHLNPERPARHQSDEMILGTAFHTFILEPNRFDWYYAIEPKKVLLKHVGEILFREYQAQCKELEKSNKIILTHANYETLLAMKNALSRNVEAMELLKDAEIEKSFFWQDKESELIVKARPDALQKNIIIDLKTISDASPRHFQRELAERWYHVQAAMVRDGIRELEQRDVSNVVYICVEKKYPYCTAIYMLDESAIDAGEKKYKDCLLSLKSCIINNDFPDYQIEQIGLPQWMM